MTVAYQRARVLLVVLMTVVLALVGLVLAVSPVQAQDGQPTDEACLACHQQPFAPHELPSGELMDVTIDPEIFNQSAHRAGEEKVSCVTCHPDISDYPHPENPGVQDRRDYTLMYRDNCLECHEEQYSELDDSVHTQALLSGDKNAPVCSDCHNPHTQPLLEAEEGKLDPGQGAMIAQTCAKCHNQIFIEYADSVHGAGVLQEGNPDTPTCTDCHGVHQIGDPNTHEFRLQSPRLCSDCHTDAQRMAKYDLSTDVLDTYVSDFHGTTWTLFEQEHPDQELNTPVCYDCHGVHNIVSVDDPERGLALKENMLASCQTCHPDATDNFPASWMSHYIASPTRYPLVYWVQVFYRFFIPAVLGGMGLLVITDILHRVNITGRRKANPPAAKGSKE